MSPSASTTLNAGCIYAIMLHPKPAQSLLCKSYIVPSTRPVKPFLLSKFSSFPFPTPQLMSNPSFLQSFLRVTQAGERKRPGELWFCREELWLLTKKKTNTGEQRVKNAVPSLICSKHESEDEAPSYLKIPGCSSLSAASLLATLAVTGTHLCMAMSTEKRFVLCIWYHWIVTRNKRQTNCLLEQVNFFKWHMKNYI